MPELASADLYIGWSCPNNHMYGIAKEIYMPPTMFLCLPCGKFWSMEQGKELPVQDNSMPLVVRAV